jgi:hypothetical protein
VYGALVATSLAYVASSRPKSILVWAVKKLKASERTTLLGLGFQILNRADAGLDGGRKRYRAACAGVGQIERRNDSFSSNDFHWKEEAEDYRCPAGNALSSEWGVFKNGRSHVTKANTIILRSRQTDCVACPMKAHCYPNTAFRKISRSVDEAASDVAWRVRVIRKALATFVHAFNPVLILYSDISQRSGNDFVHKFCKVMICIFFGATCKAFASVTGQN